MSFWDELKGFIKSAIQAAASPKAGTTLGGTIDAAITTLETEERTRATIITELATAASITEDEVNQIISGDTMCPTKPVLEAFAPVLNLDTDVLVTAAEADGCTYETEDEDADAKAQAEVLQQFKQLNEQISLLKDELTAANMHIVTLKATIKAQEAAGAAAATSISPSGQEMGPAKKKIDTSSWTNAAKFSQKYPKKN